MTTAIDRAERIKKSINGSRNGSSSEIDIETVMNEWLEEQSKVKEALYALRKPWDKRRPAEDEFDNILFVIEIVFSFGWGGTPNDEPECELCERGDKRHMDSCEKLMLWDYPEFAKIVSVRARNLKIKTRELITRSFQPLIDNRGNIRRRVLEELLGQEFVRDRIRENINASKRRKGRRLEQREEKRLEEMSFKTHKTNV